MSAPFGYDFNSLVYAAREALRVFALRDHASMRYVMAQLRKATPTEAEYPLVTSTNIFDALPSIMCEHDPGVKCINCDTPHSTLERSA